MIKKLKFPEILEAIVNLQKDKNVQFISVKRFRKLLKLNSNAKLVHEIIKTLNFLEHYKFLKLVKKYPKLYKIPSDFGTSKKIQNIIKMYKN